VIAMSPKRVPATHIRHERVKRYILERQCREGGFCFYKLEEPNGADTYFALATLQMLGVAFTDERTMAYLSDMQRSDGGYGSVASAFYSLQGLASLKKKPRRDPSAYILQTMKKYRLHPESAPAGTCSIFEPLMHLTDIQRTFCRELDAGVADRIIRQVLACQNADKGFGHRQSTLIDTAYALAILELLNYPLAALQADQFLKKCETPLSGFTNIPRTSLSFMEYVHAGILASAVISRRPRYFQQCVDFITYCQNKSGGFSRVAQGGLATLEDSYYAIHGLAVLSLFELPLPGSAAMASDFTTHFLEDR
jgi:hypothetical protein